MEKRMIVLGIDAAWTENHPSGVCLIRTIEDNSCEIIRASSSYSSFISSCNNVEVKPVGSKLVIGEIIGALKSFEFDCIAIDMPLSNELITSRRSSEGKISKYYGAKGAATHSPNSTRPGKLALDIVTEARELGYTLSLVGEESYDKSLIEVYPHASIIEYLDLDYRYMYKVSKKNKYNEWKDLKPEVRDDLLKTQLNKLIIYLKTRLINIDEFLPLLDLNKKYTGWQLKEYEDIIDSSFCALTGVDYMNRRTIGYGGLDGTIWVPDKRKIFDEISE